MAEKTIDYWAEHFLVILSQNGMHQRKTEEKRRRRAASDSLSTSLKCTKSSTLKANKHME